MNYFSELEGLPIVDPNGTPVGTVDDLGIAASDVFPRVLTLMYKGPTHMPYMISWTRNVSRIDDDGITLSTRIGDLRFSYLHPNEILIARDLIGKQVVDLQDKNVETVNDAKISVTASGTLRLVGVDVGLSGTIRRKYPLVKGLMGGVGQALGIRPTERIIPWDSLDLIDKSLSNMKLSATHRRLDELHAADVADIIAQLDEETRPKVFQQLEDDQAALVLAELPDEVVAEFLDTIIPEDRAARLILDMDPDEAADIVGHYPPERQDALLREFDAEDADTIRELLGYEARTAGGIMTTEFVAVAEGATVGEAIQQLRELDEAHEEVNVIYTVDPGERLSGMVSLQRLATAEDDEIVGDLAELDIITASPDDDQEDVAVNISKYDLIAMPVVDDDDKLIGVVTVDDALEVLEEEHEEDLMIAGGSSSRDDDQIRTGGAIAWFAQRELWFVVWMIAGIVALALGAPDAYLVALIPLPLVLVVAEDSIAYARNRVLEYPDPEEEKPRLGPLFRRNLFTGILIALITALLMLVGIILPLPVGALNKAPFALAAGAASLTILFIILGSTLVTDALIRRIGRGEDPPNHIISLIMLVATLVTYLLIVTAFFFAWDVI